MLEDNARAADALVLAGEVSAARNVWLALSSPMAPPLTPAPASEDNHSRQIRLRSYYNLASSTADRTEEASWLEKLFTQQGNEGSLGIYSIIRYTRLLDSSRGITVLDDESMKEKTLLDLELLRRRLEMWPQKRAVAEIWLLLNRHPEDEALYEWAAWYFDFQKFYSETAQLFKEAARKGMDGSWLKLHRSLALIREGKINEGENILKEAFRTSANWMISANLGRIQEDRRAISTALGYYESAASQVKDKSSAAQIQIRLSRCLEALGRTDESRRALEYALELDPENINVRIALRRFSGG
jgi:tetratricopeptide (TPR) repeat protein